MTTMMTYLSRILLVFIVLFFSSCSENESNDLVSTSQIQAEASNLDIPERYWGDLVSQESGYTAYIDATTITVDTSEGEKTFHKGETLQDNGVNYFDATLTEHGCHRVILTTGNGFIGISIYKENNQFLINTYYQ